jgi:hypothetical protein
MIVMIIALVLVSIAVGGSYWFFVLNKPKASVTISPTPNSAAVTITGYSGPVYILLKTGTIITHGSHVLSDKYTLTGLTPSTTYEYFILTDKMDILLASGSFTASSMQTPGAVAPSQVPAGSPSQVPDVIAPSQVPGVISPAQAPSRVPGVISPAQAPSRVPGPA